MNSAVLVMSTALQDLFCTRVVTIGEHAVDFEAPTGPLYIGGTWVRLGCVLKFVLPRFAAFCLQ